MFVRLVFSFLFGVALYLFLALGESPDGQFGEIAVRGSLDNTSPVSWIMASNYGAADASNTAVRAFLWKAGASYHYVILLRVFGYYFIDVGEGC